MARGIKSTQVSHAAYHSATRRAHAAETTEDYVEAIAELIEQTGEARVVELSKRLGISHAAVVRSVKKPQRDGFVTAKPYRSIFLTQQGKDLAQTMKVRHDLVVKFLLALGAGEDTARADAEGIEHHVSTETLDAFLKFISRSKHRSR